jgi:hypothetical protein
MTKGVEFIKLGLWAALVWSSPLAAQTVEPESPERYRKSHSFTMPDPGNANATAQLRDSQPYSGTPGLNYLFDSRTTKLLDLHKKSNEGTSEADGFRIQIYAGGDQNLANEARADFLATFTAEGYEIHQIWDPPHFRVRVGDFRTRTEAMNALPNIRRIFPDGFVVADKIKLKKAKKPQVAPDGTAPLSPGPNPSGR